MKAIFSVDREKISINVARLKKGGENFEVVINPDRVIDFKKGKIENVREVLMYEKIFYDAKKGLEASHDHMITLFETADPLKVAKIILDHGEIQFTQEYRENKRKEKFNKITDILVRNAVDPRTNLPHPRTRIEAALEEAKIKVDDFKDAEEHIQDIVHKLMPILPIKFSTKEIQIRIMPLYASKAHPIMTRYAKILSDHWQSDGSWLCTVEIPAGMQNDLFDALNKLTHGSVESKVVREH
jgi:ribosome maturation protein SDO1